MKTSYSEVEILAMLKTNNYAVERALISLYERQTATEQSAERTEEKNGVGFSAFDAEIFSSFSRQILTNKYGCPNGCRLTAKQFAICRKESKTGKMKIGKYAKQLTAIANETAARLAAAA